jgi:hypothetical protein
VAVTNIGNEWHKDNIDRFTAATQYVTSEASAFQIVAAERADITIEPIFADSYLVNKLGLNDKVAATRARFGPIKMYLLMSSQSKYVFQMDQVNSVLKKFKSCERFSEILRKYE